MMMQERIGFMKELAQRPVLFIAVWVVLFVAIALSFFSFGLVPPVLLSEDTSDETSSLEDTNNSLPTLVDTSHENEVIAASVSQASAPVRIIIDAIAIDAPVENPTNATVDVLDDALSRGAVHYPGSGNLEDTSNVFLFGHSSHLPVVHNQAYRTFNNLEKLKVGDLIRVQSATKEYQYRVDTVEQVKAEDAWVSFDSDTRKLTLSTCNNFGSKQDRFVVSATFIGSVTLGA